MLGLFVGYCYDLDSRLIDDIGVSVFPVIFLGINFVIKLVRCHQTGLSPVQPHLPFWEGPNAVYCRASRRCLQLGKVMGVRYPGPESRHNLVCPLLLLYLGCPCVGPLFVLATTVAVGVFGRHGAT